MKEITASHPVLEELPDAFALLAELVNDFSNSLDLNKTLEWGLKQIVEYLDAEAGSMWLVSPDGETVVCEACVGGEDIKGISLPMGEGIVGSSIVDNAVKIVSNVADDENFSEKIDKQSDFVTESLLCAPMNLLGVPVGAVEVVNYSRSQCQSEKDNIHLLQVLATSAALAVSNMQMATGLAEAEVVKKELDVAADIQRSLLPKPDSDDFPVLGINQPARTVSGDLYGFLTNISGRIGFCVGDVSGKGINASLLMAKTSSLFQCLAKYIESPSDLLTMINNEVNETVTRGMFVTMALGVYDPRTGRVVLANAGHEPPLLRFPNGEFVSLPANTIPLGIMPGMDLYDVEFGVPEATLYLFTDGITEAKNKLGEEIGSEGLEKIVLGHSEKPFREHLEATADDIKALELRDDLTLLGVDIASNAGISGEILFLRVSGETTSLKTIRHMLQNCLDCHGPEMNDIAIHDVVLAVDETCQNIIRYGYGGGCAEKSITLVVSLVEDLGDRQSIEIIIEDQAPYVDFRALEKAVAERDIEEIAPGGLGLHIIREIMNSFSCRPSEDQADCGNIFTMTKNV
jgi:sigma-B regulation protein RsbU (phosphoserine phosphatase)